MNPKSLRAGKAVDETGPSAPVPGTPGDISSPPELERPKSSGNPKLPPILFEGDECSKPTETAATQKFDLGAPPHPAHSEPQEAKLPDAYGTGKLLLTARDPHALFAHWDLTKEQQRHYNSLSSDGHLKLRAYAHAYSNQPAAEVPVAQESHHLFLNVERAGTSYIGELGYYQADRQWKTIATSAPTTTPPDAPSGEATAVFSTPHARKTLKAAAQAAQPSIIPVPVPRWPFEPDTPSEGEAISGEESQLQQLLPDDAPPFVKRGAYQKWSALQERLLANIIRISLARREWLSSAEIARVVEHELELPPEIPWGALVNIFSPTGEEQPARKGFWFNINAELVVYGATEANAQVTIGGRPIQLRPDGTFTCQFALPDGAFELAATAVSPENEQRQAVMNFSRHTNYSGEVGAAPQNPSLERLPQRE